MELIIHFTAIPEKLSLDAVKSDLAELLEVADDDDVRQIVAYAQLWMETGRKINRKGE